MDIRLESYDEDSQTATMTMEQVHDFLSNLNNLGPNGGFVTRIRIVRPSKDEDKTTWDACITEMQIARWQHIMNELLAEFGELDGDFHNEFDCP